MMKKSGFIIFLVTFIILINIDDSSATIILHNESLVNRYIGGDKIRGNINVSFNNINIDSRITTNFGNSITLRDFLEANGLSRSVHYNCSTANCLPGYTRLSSVNSIEIVPGGAIVGWSLQGNNVNNVNDVKLKLTTTGGPSCFQDLIVDVLGRGNNLIQSSRYIDETCFAPNYGCFERNRTDLSLVDISSDFKYCQKIRFTPAPAYRIGANITNTSSRTSILQMTLYDMNRESLSSCNLPTLTQQSGNIDCIVNYSSSVEKDFLVCIKALDVSSYKIRAESNRPCGTRDLGQSYTGDYEIYVKNLKFDRPVIEINETNFQTLTGTNLLNLINNYLDTTYNNSCNPYCVVPIRIFGALQRVTLSDASIRYENPLGRTETTSIYELSITNSTITSRPLLLDMAKANFTIPIGTQSSHLEIFIDRNRIIRKNINLTSGFSFDIEPRFAPIGIESVFSVRSPFNITQTKWRFGDGSQQKIVQGRTTTHRYTSQGEFIIEVEITRVDGMVSTQTFNVIVGDARNSANSLLSQYSNNIYNIERHINSYPLWIQDQIKTNLELIRLNQSLHEIQFRFNNATNNNITNDEVYMSIINDLLTLRVPKGIRSGLGGSLPASIGNENINVAHIEEISGTNSNNDEGLKNSIIYWMNQHYNSNISFEEIKAVYSDREETILSVFRITSTPKSDYRGQKYLVIGYPSNQLRFASGNVIVQSTNSSGGGTYISLGEGVQIVEFAINERVMVEQLGIYISPQISLLGNFETERRICNDNKVCERDFGENKNNCPNDCRPINLAIFLISAILFFGIIGLVLIRLWYKNNYESYLFPNKQDLINVITFINNSRAAGLKDREIKNKLKKSGWTGEQISYAFKKSQQIKMINVGVGTRRNVY